MYLILNTDIRQYLIWNLCRQHNCHYSMVVEKHYKKTTMKLLLLALHHLQFTITGLLGLFLQKLYNFANNQQNSFTFFAYITVRKKEKIAAAASLLINKSKWRKDMMKTWQFATALAMTVTMLAGHAFARPITRPQQHFVPLAASRPGAVYHYGTIHSSAAKEYRKTFVVRERPWRQPAASGRMLHRQPFLAISFTKPLQFVYPPTSYLYIHGVYFR